VDRPSEGLGLESSVCAEAMVEGDESCLNPQPRGTRSKGRKLDEVVEDVGFDYVVDS
jgi:hypothetical protein